MPNPDPIWMNALSYTAAEDRALVDSLFPGEGVVLGCKVTQRSAGANWSVDISAGTVVIKGDDAAGQNSYVCPIDAQNLPLVQATPNAGSQRKEKIVVKVRDASHQTGVTQNDSIVQSIVTTGNPAADPAVPLTAIPLAIVTIGAGTASITNGLIGDLRRRTKVAGGTYVAQSQTDFPPEPLKGDLRSVPSLDLETYWGNTSTNGGWIKTPARPRAMMFNWGGTNAGITANQHIYTSEVNLAFVQATGSEFIQISGLAMTNHLIGGGIYDVLWWSINLEWNYAGNPGGWGVLDSYGTNETNGPNVSPSASYVGHYIPFVSWLSVGGATTYYLRFRFTCHAAAGTMAPSFVHASIMPIYGLPVGDN